jgi:hypothetical protein
MQAHRRHRVAYALALIGLVLLLLLLITRPLEGQWGTVSGAVYDSLESRPLADARALLAGTDYEGRTDAEGRFRLEFVPPGEYTLRLEHPAAGLYGLTPIDRRVTIRAGGTVIVDLAFPSLDTVLSRLCPDAEAGRDLVHPDEPSTVLGFVHHAGSGEPVSGARVWISYSDHWGQGSDRWTPGNEAWTQIAVETDEVGAYLACGMPGNWRVIAQAEAVGAASDTVWRHTPAGEPLRLDLALSSSNEGPGVWGLDRRAAFGDVLDPIVDAESRTATLLGTVKSAETGEPVKAARVRVVGTDIDGVTQGDGTFVIEGLAVGRYRVVTEHLGMASDTAMVDLRGGAVSLAVLTLETRPIELPSLDVEIERTYRNPRIAGFHQRMRRGIGEFITAEDLEYTDVIGNFRRLPNVSVGQCVNPKTGLRVVGCWDLSIARGYSLRMEGCPPLIYLNGQLISAPDSEKFEREVVGVQGNDAFTFLQSYPRHSIEGIEVYRNPAGAPGQYRMLGDACGIVLVWTGTRRSRP